MRRQIIGANPLSVSAKGRKVRYALRRIMRRRPDRLFRLPFCRGYRVQPLTQGRTKQCAGRTRPKGSVRPKHLERAPHRTIALGLVDLAAIPRAESLGRGLRLRIHRTRHHSNGGSAVAWSRAELVVPPGLLVSRTARTSYPQILRYNSKSFTTRMWRNWQTRQT